MVLFAFLSLFFSLISYSSGATYCICKDGISEAALQKTIDYACGTGADCRPILQNGACFQPNTLKSHCDYAANSYFQNKAPSGATCDFSSTAITSNNLPNTVVSGCTYPSSPGTTTGGDAQTAPTGTDTGAPGSPTTGAFGPTSSSPTNASTSLEQSYSLIPFALMLLLSWFLLMQG